MPHRRLRYRHGGKQLRAILSRKEVLGHLRVGYHGQHFRPPGRRSQVIMALPALDTHHAARTAFVDMLGIEPYRPDHRPQHLWFSVG